MAAPSQCGGPVVRRSAAARRRWRRTQCSRGREASTTVSRETLLLCRPLPTTQPYPIRLLLDELVPRTLPCGATGMLEPTGFGYGDSGSDGHDRMYHRGQDVFDSVLPDYLPCLPHVQPDYMAGAITKAETEVADDIEFRTKEASDFAASEKEQARNIDELITSRRCTDVLSELDTKVQVASGLAASERELGQIIDDFMKNRRWSIKTYSFTYRDPSSADEYCTDDLSDSDSLDDVSSSGISRCTCCGRVVWQPFIWKGWELCGRCFEDLHDSEPL